MLICFFFQAEDGIRDAQESRGLGDVYKRQVQPGAPGVALPVGTGKIRSEEQYPPRPQPVSQGAVSYTHLTLPTIYPV